jgi:hypothetical protein
MLLGHFIRVALFLRCVPQVCEFQEERRELSRLPTRPEDRARETFDRQLAAAGWRLQDSKAMNLYARRGVAVPSLPGAAHPRLSPRRAHD